MNKTSKRFGIMERLAVDGKRDLIDWAREKTDIWGIASEKFFNPEFKEIMDKLRDNTDDPVRAIVSGSSVGKSSAPEDPISLKDLLKETQSLLNRREYLTAISYLWKFNKKLNEIAAILSSFTVNTDAIHKKFLFDIKDEHNVLPQLQELKTKFELPQKSSNSKHNIVKIAGFMDSFVNIFTERGRALERIEERFPKKTKKLAKDTSNILNKSFSLLSNIFSILSNMATARATRNVEDYLSHSSKLVSLITSYNDSFQSYYDNIKEFLDLLQSNVAKLDTKQTKQPNLLLRTTDAVKPDATQSVQTSSTEKAPDTENTGSPNFDSAKSNVQQSSVPVNNNTQQQTVTPPTIQNTNIQQTVTTPNTTNINVQPPTYQKNTLPSPGNSSSQQTIAPSTTPPTTMPGSTGPDTLPNSTGPATSPGSVGPATSPSSVGPATLPSQSDEELKSDKILKEIVKNNPDISTSPDTEKFDSSTAPPTEKSVEKKNTIPGLGPVPKISHINFYNQLESLSKDQSPEILAKYIKKYAYSIKAKDPKTAIKLFDLANKIEV